MLEFASFIDSRLTIKMLAILSSHAYPLWFFSVTTYCISRQSLDRSFFGHVAIGYLA